jgi:hypothetical protein
MCWRPVILWGAGSELNLSDWGFVGCEAFGRSMRRVFPLVRGVKRSVC